MALNQEQVSQLYVALFGRASEGEGNQNWINQNLEMGATADLMLSTDAAKDYYGSSMDSNDAFIKFIYLNTLGKTYEDDKASIDAWVAYLNDSGKSRGEVVAELIAEAIDPKNAGAAQDLFNNKVEVSNYMAENVYNNPADWETSTAFKSNAKPDAALNVTSDPESVTAAEEAIDALTPAPTEEPGQEFVLEVSRDNLVGTNKADTFIADVAQNQNGSQVNTLGSGDIINGGAGNDTLDATLIAAYNVAGKAMDITATTKSVENIIINAQISDNASSATDEVILNARKMEGVTKISSTESDADLLVKNMTTNGVTGGTAAQTVEFAYSGNKDTAWKEADMTVYYDQDYLTRSSEEINALDLILVNAVNNAEGENPVEGFKAINFKVGTVNVSVDVSDIAAKTTGLATIYQDVADKINAKLAELGLTTVKATVLSETEAFFSIPIPPFSAGSSAGNYNPIRITNLGEEALVGETIETNKLDYKTELNGTFNEVDTENNDTPVSINVDLEKVGLAGHGGSLVIGSMNKDTTNTFNAKDSTTDTVAGFEVFNVDVNGAADKASSLSALHSTNNTLRKVEIVSEDRSAEKVKTNADLTIGNTNTAGAGAFGTVAKNAQALKDVQVFDASAFKGNLTLNAGITNEIVAKYLASDLNLSGDLAFTNEIAQFTYNAGSGNDKLNIAIDGATINQNLAAFTQAVGAGAVAGMPEFDLTTSDANAVAGGTAVNVYFDGTNYLTAAGYVVSTYTDATSGETYLVYNNAGTINYLFGYTVAAGVTAGAVAANAPVLKDDGAGVDTAVLPADLATFNPNASTVALDIVYTNIVTSLDDTNGVNLFDLDINGNAGNDEIVVTVEGQVTAAGGVNVSTASNITINGGTGNDLIDISANDTDWTFTVEFNGNFGTDTILGFNNGAVAISAEKQALDLTGFAAHAGETISVTVGDKTTTFTAATDMNQAAVETQVLSMLVTPTAPTAPTVTQQFDAGSSLTSLNGLDKDIQSVTVEVKSGSTVLNSADSTTQVQGGIHYSVTPSDGADVLDFSAYGVKGLITLETGYTGTTLVSTIAAKTGTKADGDSFLALIESSHKAGLYDVYQATQNATLDIDGVLSGTKLGSIDLSDTTTNITANLDASQFLLV